MNPVEQQDRSNFTSNAKCENNWYHLQLQRSKLSNSSGEDESLCSYKGIKVEEVTVSNVNDIQQAAQNLVSQRVDAVYVPTDNVVASAMSNLVAITDPAKIPVFGGEDNHVKGGAVMPCLQITTNSVTKPA